MSTGQAQGGERRRHERHPLTEKTSLKVVTDRGTYPCAVEDLSLGGVKLRFQDDPPDVEVLRLEHPTVGAFIARRRWSGGDAVGVEFDERQRDLERALQCIALMVTPDDALEGRGTDGHERPRAGSSRGKVA